MIATQTNALFRPDENVDQLAWIDHGQVFFLEAEDDG